MTTPTLTGPPKRPPLHPLDYSDRSSNSMVGLPPLTAWPWPLCPTKGREVFRDPRTGRLRPRACGTVRCPVCIVPVALRYAAAIALAEPERLVLLTGVAAEWSTIRKQINRYRQAVRKLGAHCQDAYHVEENPAGTGNHVHMWGWGGAIDEAVVSAAANSAGLGLFSGVQQAFVPETGRLVYGMKAVLEDRDTDGAMTAHAERFLELNGGRLLHATRGYWRDGAKGARLGGVRQAAKVAAARRMALEPVVPGITAASAVVAA